MFSSGNGQEIPTLAPPYCPFVAWQRDGVWGRQRRWVQPSVPPSLPTLFSSNIHGTQLWPAGSIGPSARRHSVALPKGKGQRTMLPSADPPTTAIAPPQLTSTSSLLASASAVQSPPPPSPPEQQQRGSAVVPAIAGYSATGRRWGSPRQQGYACRTSGKRMRWGSSLKNCHRQKKQK